LKEYKKDNPQLTGDVHFFAGTKEIAQKFLDLGFYISFTGVITFAKMYEEIVASIPMNRILSETDAPYVSPVPFRGKRNEPSNVREVVKKIAEIKELDENVMVEQIMQNAKKLFKLE
jgi:TatD DNase family protein